MNPINPQNEHFAESTIVPHTPKMNALKHGRRSAAVLLPGDDIIDFRQRRRELFEEHNPCTRSEADCVEAIVGYKWRIEHCQRLEAKFRAALNQVAGVYPEADHICEPDPHRWQHRAMDCTLEERRLKKMQDQELQTLFLLQRMRRNRLIDGAIHTTKTYRDFVGEEPVALVEPQEENTSATPSTDRTNSGSCERNSTPASMALSPSPAVGGGARGWTSVLRVGEVAARVIRRNMGAELNAHPETAPGTENLARPLANPPDPR
jgi:hypothetical protein